MSKVVYRRIRGRIVPIHKPDQRYRAAGYATAIASGAISGVSLVGGVKRVAFGQGASLGLDAVSVGLLGRAHAKGGASSRTKARHFGRDVAISQGVSWGIFGAAALAHKPTREAGIKVVKKAAAAIISYKLRTR